MRSYLAQHGMDEGDISKFVEDAVYWQVLNRTVADTKAANADIPSEQIEAEIDEALHAVRAERFRLKRS